MSMLDRLRESALGDDEELFGPEIDESLLVSNEEVRERLILGMNAVERMFAAIFVFLNVAILGVLILIALGRIDIGLTF